MKIGEDNSIINDSFTSTLDSAFNDGFDEGHFVGYSFGYEDGRAEAIDEYKQLLLESLTPLQDEYFNTAKGTPMPEQRVYLKRADTVDLIIEMVKLKAEQLKHKED